MPLLGPSRTGPIERREAELIVLLPVHVRRQLQQTPETALALAHDFFGLLAPHELADLSADHARGLQQSLVGLANAIAGKAENADHPPFRYRRENERPVDAEPARQVGVLRARLLVDIRDAERLVSPPDGP